MYTIEFNLPNLAKDASIVVDGLGVFENNSTSTITKEQADSFRLHNRRQSGEYDGEGTLIYKDELGPTLLQAFNAARGIIVKTEQANDDVATKSVTNSTTANATDITDKATDVLTKPTEEKEGAK